MKDVTILYIKTYDPLGMEEMFVENNIMTKPKTLTKFTSNVVFG